MKTFNILWRAILWMILGALCFSVSAQEKKLLIWSHWGEEPVKVRFMNAVAEAFQQEHGVAVEIVWIPKNDLIEKLTFALDTAEPDITYLDFGFDHPRILRSLLDLSDLEFTGEIDPSWTLQRIGGESNNFLPIEGISSGIYYNKDLLKQAGVVVPQGRGITNEDFLEMVRKLRSVGIMPIGEGSANRTVKIGIPIINTIFRYAGPEKVAQLYEGKINFSDPDIRSALEFWKRIVDAQGYDPSKVLKLSLTEGIFEVTDGHAALSFCGTFFYSKYGTTERDRGQVGVLDWFSVENGKGNNYYEILWGAGFGINRNSAYVEEAKKFLEYLMSPMAASLWVKYIQAPYPVIAEEIAPDSLYGMLTAQRHGQQPAPLEFTFYVFTAKAAQQAWEEATRRFVLGELTVDQFIELMNSRLP